MKTLAFTVLSVLAASVSDGGMTSDPTFILVNPETSSFWNTATGSTITVQLDYPAGATSASPHANPDDVTGYRLIFDAH